MNNNEKYEPEDITLLKYLKGTLPEEEKQSVQDWLKANPENEKTLLQIGRIDFTIERQNRIKERDTLAAYEKVEQRIAAKGKRRKLHIVYIAAAIAALVIANIGLINYLTKPNMDNVITLNSKGSKKVEYILPDGTIAYLNSNSSLVFPVEYASDERKVILEGEAYFKVAHNAKKPFIVSTADENVNIKVLGTTFNIQAYAGDSIIQATLIEGSVNMSMKNTDGTMSDVLMKPSQQVTFNLNSKKPEIEEINYNGDIAWMDNKLVFSDTPMSEISRQLSYFYNIEIEVQDINLNEYIFTGTFENKRLEDVLEYLKISSGIKYKLTRAQGIITKVTLSK